MLNRIFILMIKRTKRHIMYKVPHAVKCMNIHNRSKQLCLPNHLFILVQVVFLSLTMTSSLSRDILGSVPALEPLLAEMCDTAASVVSMVA